MRWSKGRTSAAIACLIVGPLAMFAQYVVTPVPGGNASVAQTLHAIARHQTAMAWVLALDVPLMLVIPALFCAGLLAGAATSRLAAIATALVVLPSIAAVVLLGQDALLYVAAQQADRGAAVALVKDFVDNPFVELVTFGYLALHLIAYPLLAIALRRARVLPLAAAVGLGVWPVLEGAGLAADVKPIAALAYFLQFFALALCAASLASSRQARAVSAQTARAVS